MTPRTRLVSFVSFVIAASSMFAVVAVAPSASAASCGVKTAADGSVGPITCKGGAANMAVRSRLQKESPRVMALGKKVSLTQVKTAVCADITKAQADTPTVNAVADRLLRVGEVVHVVVHQDHRRRCRLRQIALGSVATTGARSCAPGRARTILSNAHGVRAAASRDR